MPLKGYKAHKTLHQDGGSDELLVTGLSGLLADDQHVLDAEVTAVAIAKSLLTEQGDIIYASGVATPAALPHGTSSQYLKSGGDAANPSWDTPAGGGPTIVLKTADEIVNNSNTLQNDNHLLFAVAANEVWDFYMALKYTTAATPGIKLLFTVPTAGAIEGWLVPDIGVLTALGRITGRDLDLYAIEIVSANADLWLIIWGQYVGGANAGNVQLQWAQDVSNASNTIVRKNSYLIAHKLG